MTNNNYNRTPRSFPPKNNNSPPCLPKRDSQTPRTSGKVEVSLKKIVCFKCHAHGNYRDAYPNNRAFTAQEWMHIREDTKPKVMFVAKNGGEEESWPSVPSDEPEGSYKVTGSGRLVRYEHNTEDSDSEEERERVLPEDEQYIFDNQKKPTYHN